MFFNGITVGSVAFRRQLFVVGRFEIGVARRANLFPARVVDENEKYIGRIFLRKDWLDSREDGSDSSRWVARIDSRYFANAMSLYCIYPLASMIEKQ